MDLKRLEEGYDKLKESNVCLKHVKESFLEQDLLIKEWAYLKSLYVKDYDTERNQKKKFMRMVITIANSAITQKRIYFALSLRIINKLIKTDKNWKIRVDMHSGEFADFKRWCYKEGFMEKVKEGTGGSVWVFKIVNKDVLGQIPTGQDNQKEEALCFQEEYIKRRKKTKKTPPSGSGLVIQNVEAIVDPKIAAIENSGIKIKQKYSVRQPDGTYIACKNQERGVKGCQ